MVGSAHIDSEFAFCGGCSKQYLLSGTPHVCGAVAAQHPPGAFNKCLRQVYFPFLLRTSLHGIRVPKSRCSPSFLIPWLGIVWLALFGVCAAFGPNFLNNTRSGLDVPPGTPSAIAQNVMDTYYPDASGWPPAIVLQHLKDGHPGAVTNNSTLRVSELLNQFRVKHSAVVQGVSGFFELTAANLPLLAATTLSEDQRSMISTVSINKDAELADVTKMAKELLEFVHEMHFNDVEVGATGIFLLFGEMQEATEKNFGMIDGVALPVCVIILGLNLRSWKHMFIAMVNLGVTILMSFAILYPISDVIDINPFSPSIMMSLGIAVCFDYSLFMLNRFREAIVQEGKDTQEALLDALQSAGHVVVLSGTTLLATFLLLLIFPQNFLQSVGWACSAVVLAAIIVNMSITPCMILAIKSLSTFEALPACMVPKGGWKCICLPDRKKRGPTDFPLEDITSGDPKPAESSSEAAPSTASTTTGETPSSASSPTGETPSTISSNQGETAATTEGEGKVAVVKKKVDNDVEIPPAATNKNFKRSCWFRVSYAITKQPWLAFICSLGVMAGFVYLWEQMVVTSDDSILFLQGSSSLNTLEKMREEFDEGMLDPFYIVLVPKNRANNSILTPEYFGAESNLIHTILATQSKYAIASSFSALTMFASQNVTLSDAMGYFTEGSPNFNSTIGSSYRLTAGGLMNSARSATLMRISTIVHPNSQAIVPFVDDVRAILEEMGEGPVNGYLFGAYSSNYDVQNALYALSPFLYCSTIAIVLIIVGMSFHSVLVALRLGITIIMSLSWTYGLMTLVYQPGPAQRAFAVIGPSLSQSSGIYWIIPIMSFSILVGLALDYDIFLMSRVLEFRREGWSDRASICLAIEKTGGIITAAGIIMAVSFAGLLFPDTTALNQYGFSLAIGVTLDTFVVRTILVPAVFTAFSCKPSANWWPGRMPPVLLDPETEYKALMAGYWHPPEKMPNLDN